MASLVVWEFPVLWWLLWMRISEAAGLGLWLLFGFTMVEMEVKLRADIKFVIPRYDVSTRH